MNYIKKMCILRQAKQGFSGDGKTLSGLIKIEQYGKNLAVEISVINFAPLVSGEYYCLLSDNKGKTEMLSLRGKSLFNILSDLDISDGFCGIICYVKNEVVPIAYGINGNGSYDWRKILNATLPPVFPSIFSENAPAYTKKNQPTMVELNEEKPKNEPPVSETNYDDESVAKENYYEEKTHEQELARQNSEDAIAKSYPQTQTEQNGDTLSENVDDERILHPFAKDSDGYYLAIKGEIDELFSKYPLDKTLLKAFPTGKFVRLRGSELSPTYLVGVLYEEEKVRYICYALKAEDKTAPPKELKNVCSFVPTKAYDEEEGFFVIFQSATTGECIKPQSV